MKTRHNKITIAAPGQMVEVDAGTAPLVAALNKLPGIETVSSSQSDREGLASVNFGVRARGERAADATVCRLLRHIQEALRRARVAGHLSFHFTDKFSSCELKCAPADVVRAAKAIERRHLLIMRKTQRSEKPVPRSEKPADPQIDRRNTQEDEFRLPIVKVLVELGGSSKCRFVVPRVGEKLSHRLTAADRGNIESGPIRWVNRAHRARKRMVDAGILEPTANVPYGVWKLTAKGWKAWEDELEYEGLGG
jgi:Mrr N-terminal domain